MEVTYCGLYLELIVYDHFFTWRSTMSLTTCQVKKNKQMVETPEQMNHAEMHSSSSQ